jgi:pyridoxal/pyridoxine/pyridoxamine kinase
MCICCGVFTAILLLLTRYTNRADVLAVLAEGIQTIKASRGDGEHRATYVCDPVLGDHGRFYVQEPEALLGVYRSQVLPLADVVTPNQFEALALTGRLGAKDPQGQYIMPSIATPDAALEVCRELHALTGGRAAVCITGLDFGHAAITAEWEVYLDQGLPAWSQTHNADEWAQQSSGAQRAPLHCSSGMQTIAHLDAGGDSFGWVSAPRIDASFAGAGDLFTALLTHNYHASRVPLLMRDPLSPHLPPCASSSSSSSSFRSAIERSATTVMEVLDHGYSRECEGGGYGGRKTPAASVLEDIDIVAASSIIRHSSLTASTHRDVLVSKSRPAPCTTLRGVIFDMDGTLTRPGAIDFADMYIRTGMNPKGGDIVTQVMHIQRQRSALCVCTARYYSLESLPPD